MKTPPRATTRDYLRELGVADLPPLTSPFDPGYDPLTLESHLSQSHHLMAAIKISMACWLVADEEATRRKVAAAKDAAVPAVTGGGPFEVAVAQRKLPQYLELCADIGFSRIECGAGFTDVELDAKGIVGLAADHGLEVQFEVGDKHAEFSVDSAIAIGTAWLNAGAVAIVVEARESAAGVGLFDASGGLDTAGGERLVEALGLDRVVFEAPTKASQFAFLSHFGPHVRLGNVRLEELLRVEIYRRGLHSDAFNQPKLRPRRDHGDDVA
jgi:phosphosulfolactate synthase